MDPENIDWDSIESIFVEDDSYESFDAPQWVDLSVPDERISDHESWFCRRDCKHPRTVDDFQRKKLNSKLKILRSVSISEMVPFRNRTRRGLKIEEQKNVNSESPKIEGLNCSDKVFEDAENWDPNCTASDADNGRKPGLEHSGDSAESYGKGKDNRKAQLKSTLSGRNLFARGDILNHLTDFCAELKRLAKKKATWKVTEEKKTWSGIQGKPPSLERERAPMLVVKGGKP